MSCEANNWRLSTMRTQFTNTPQRRDRGAIGEALELYGRIEKDEKLSALWISIAGNLGVEAAYKAFGGKREFHHLPVDPRVAEELIKERLKGLFASPTSSEF